MAEGSAPCFYLIHDLTGVFPDFLQESVLAEISLCNIRQLLFPVCSELRFFQILRNKLQKLFCLGSQMDFISLFLHHKAFKKLFDNICSGCNCAKPSGLPQCFCCLPVPCGQILNRVFHGSKKSGFRKSCRRFCFSFLQTESFCFKLFSLLSYRKALIPDILLLIFILVPVISLVNLFPSGTYHCFSAGCKAEALRLCLHGGLLIFKSRIKNA